MKSRRLRGTNYWTSKRLGITLRTVRAVTAEGIEFAFNTAWDGQRWSAEHARELFELAREDERNDDQEDEG